MNQNPYQSPDVVTGPTAGLPPGTRPATATVFGILNLVFGVMGILSILCMSVGMYLFTQFGDPAIFEEVVEFQQPGYRVYMVANSVVSFGLAILLVVAGTGLMKFKPYGRVLSIWYAIPAIISILVGLGFQLYFALAPRLTSGEALTGAEQAGAIGGVIGGLIGSLFGLIYPVLLLFFMYRQPFRSQITGE